MSEQQNRDIYEDEIDLKDLFMVLWKGKKVIIAITLIVAILTALVTKFIIEPVYETNVNLVVNIPAAVNTKYGDYTMMMTTNDQYIDLIYNSNLLSLTMQELNIDKEKNSIEKFSKRISITQDEKKPNTFNIKVKGKSPKESLEIANCLYKNYIIFLDQTIKLRCADYFESYYSTELSKDLVNLDVYTKQLEQNKEILAKTPQTINQNDAMEIVNTNSVNYVVLENIINENYKKVELDIITVEQAIDALENKTEVSKLYLDELTQIKEKVKNNSLDVSFCEVIKNSIFLPSQLIAPTHKTSPSTALNTIIGAVLGGMISVIYVLVKKYWFTEVK